MEVDDRKRLQANYSAILKDVRAKDVKDHLEEAGVLSKEDVEEVSLSSITPTERTRRLLSILPRRGPKAFSAFIESLREEYEYLVKQILDTDISKVVLADDGDDIDYREKMNTLQKQLWQQTQMMVGYQSELMNLRGTVEELEQQRVKETEVYDKLAEKGLQRREFLAFMEYNDGRSHEETDSGRGAEDSINLPSDVMRSHTDPVLIKQIAMELASDVMHYLGNPKTARPAKSQYVINMRRIVADIFQIHNEIFHGIITDLTLTEMNGYETLLRVADEMFRGQTNWGRVGVWYTFGASVGIYCEAKNMPEIGKWIAEFTGIYVAQNLLEWIQKNDGWNGLNKFVADKDEANRKGGEKGSEESSSGSLGLTLGALGLVGVTLGAYAAFKAS